MIDSMSQAEGAKSRIRKLNLAPLWLLPLVILSLLPGLPLLRPLPHRDSAVFIYSGQLILDGRTPYIDVWDHKGPLVYLANAFGLALTDKDLWGIWIVQIGVLLAAVFLAYRLLESAFGRPAAIVGTVAFLLSATGLMDGGNYTEVYTLPLQFAALLIFWRSSRENARLSRVLFSGLALGALGMGAFLFRANNAGTVLLVAVALFFALLRARRVQNLFCFVVALLGGAVLVALPVFVFLAGNHALGEWWQQSIVFNVQYSNVPASSRLSSMAGLLLGATPAVFSVLILHTFVLVVTFLGRRSNRRHSYAPVLIAAALDFVLEISLAGSSGRLYKHYFIAVLPPAIVLLAWHVHYLHEKLMARSPGIRPGAYTAGIVALLALAFLHPVMAAVADAQNAGVEAKVLVGIAEQSREIDSLLMWGAATEINLAVGVPAPTRYVYQYPLFFGGGIGETAASELLVDLDRTPSIVVDTSATNPDVPPLDAAAREAWSRRIASETGPIYGQYRIDAVQPVFDYIAANYVVADRFDNGWVLYTPSATLLSKDKTNSKHATAIRELAGEAPPGGQLIEVCERQPQANSPPQWYEFLMP